MRSERGRSRATQQGAREQEREALRNRGTVPLHRALGHGVKHHRPRSKMAQEVSLNSLQELEREAVLRVLHRDQAVQSIEEERVR